MVSSLLRVAKSHLFESVMPVSVVQLASQFPQKMQVSYRCEILLTGGSASRSSSRLKHLGAGQTFTHAPQPIHLSRSNSGLPLYLSGTMQGFAGNRVVKRGEKTAITASFNSRNFGKRNFKLLLVFGNCLLINGKTHILSLINFFCIFINDAVFPQFHAGSIGPFGDCVRGSR